MTLKKIEDFKRKLIKAIGRPVASARIYDNNTHFKLKSERSKAIGVAAKLLVWANDLEKDIEQ